MHTESWPAFDFLIGVATGIALSTLIILIAFLAHELATDWALSKLWGLGPFSMFTFEVGQI